MLTVRRERELVEGINKRISRKLDRQWKKSIVVRPPPSLQKLQEEEAAERAAEAEKSAWPEINTLFERKYEVFLCFFVIVRLSYSICDLTSVSEHVVKCIYQCWSVFFFPRLFPDISVHLKKLPFLFSMISFSLTTRLFDPFIGPVYMSRFD